MLEATDGFAAASVPFAVGKTTATGTAADLYSCGAAIGVLMVGEWTDGTFTFDLEDSDDNDTFASAAASVIGTLPVIDDATRDGDVIVCDYKGGKRYLRWSCVVTDSPSTGMSFGCGIIGMDARTKPYSSDKPLAETTGE